MQPLQQSLLDGREHATTKQIRTMEHEYKLNVTEHNLTDVIHRFCWYYSLFSTKKTATAPPDSPLLMSVAKLA
jgi:hypothetical protein